MTATVEQRVLIGAASVLALCILTLTVFVVRREMRSEDSANTSGSLATEDWQELTRSGTAVGDTAAAHTLLVFSDYQCPACKDFDVVVEDFQRQHPADIRVVYRHFPLRALHPLAEAAALSAECASAAGAFVRYHKLLFTAQDSLGVLSWAQLAHRAGVGDTASFRECVDTRRFAPRVSEDLREAERLKLRGTPTAYLDGRAVPSGASLKVIEERFQSQVQASKQ